MSGSLKLNFKNIPRSERSIGAASTRNRGKTSPPRSERSIGAASTRTRGKTSPPRSERSIGAASTSTPSSRAPVGEEAQREMVSIRGDIDGSDRKFYIKADELKRRAAAEGRTVQIEGGRYIDPSDVGHYNRAQAAEAKAEERDRAQAEGRTVEIDGNWVHPSDVGHYNRARDAEAKADEKEKAHAEGRTVEIDGQWVHPSDVGHYNRARDAEARAEEKEKAHAEGRTVEIDGQWVHPSDVGHYNRARDAEAKAREAEEENGVEEAAPVGQPEEGGAPSQAPETEEMFVLPDGDEDNPFQGHNATSVTVTPWDGHGEGGNPNDSISSILLNQGYTLDEILKADENGQTLIDQVAGANDIEDPNIIHPGADLVVPTRHDATEEASESTTSQGPTRLVNPSDVHLYNRAAEIEKKQAHEQGRTVEVNGEWVDPSDVRLYNRAAELEKEKAHAEGRTVQVNGEWVNPADVRLYNRAAELEREKALAEGRTVEIPA